MTCALLPVQTLMSLHPQYIADDPTGSIVDPAAQIYNLQQIEPTDNFMGLVEQNIDKSWSVMGQPLTDCAYTNFANWAANDAILTDPTVYDATSFWKRGEYTVGIMLCAVKLKALGYTMTTTIKTWLSTLLYKTLPQFEPVSQQQNKRVWTGAAAALYCLIDNTDSRISDFHSSAWTNTIGSINANGTIDTELSRGQRSLIYHLYSFSGTLMLRSARKALGHTESATDHSAFQCLANFIGMALGSPSLLTPLAGATQETPPTSSFHQIVGFAADFTNLKFIPNKYKGSIPQDTTFGGDMTHSANVLADW